MANPPQSPSDPGRIIPAADVERIISRFGCLKRSQSQGIANLRYVHSAAWQAGYREGLDRATAELAQFHGAIEAYRSGAASPVTELVFAVLRKVLGDIEAGTLVAEIADKALAECAEQLESVVVCVHPDAIGPVTERLERITRERDGIRFDVRVGDHLGETGCELHTVFGIIEASIDTQLDQLERHIQRASRG